MIENWTNENAHEYLNTLPAEWVNDSVNAVEGGHADALRTYINLYRLSKLLSEAMDRIKPDALNEATKYGKTFQFHGCEIQNKNAPGRFVFKSIPEWQEQQFRIKQIEDKYKSAWQAREKGLTSITDDGEILDLSGMEYFPGGLTFAIKLL